MRNLALFALMSLIWGVTWAAIVYGLQAGVPPVLLAALRYALATLFLAFLWREARAAFTNGRAARAILSALLVNAGTYGLLFWGMEHVPSGLSGLVNLSLIPIFLFGLAALTGEERPTLLHALPLAIGALGLVSLFWTRLEGYTGTSATGLVAIVLGTASYCAGSVVARPLVGPVRPLTLTFVQAGLGTPALLLVSALLGEWEEVDPAAASVPLAAASLLFLSLLGTVLAYTLYLKLLREWGTARAGLYAFVSPIIALIVGWAALGETIGPVEIGGAAAMLLAAGIALLGHRTEDSH
jgi:drug/metabolite transporter (DMT)-like permease